MMREKLRRLSLSELTAVRSAWWLLFCALIIALGCAGARAGDGRALRGLKTVALVIERLDPESRNCGIDDQTIRSAITAALASGRLKLSAGETKTSLSVVLTTFYDEDTSRCVSHIELEVYVPTETADWPIAKTVLWSSGALIIAEQARYRERVKLALEERANQLVVDWTAAQR